MPPGVLLPPAIQQFFDSNGKPLDGGSIAWYLAGTSTPSPAYADSGLVTPLANPVPLSNPGGRAPAMWLDGALAYKEVLLDGAGSTIWTADNLTSGQSVPTVTVAASGNVFNVAVPTAPVVGVQFTNTAASTSVTGFVGGQPGQLLVLRAVPTAQVLLYPNNSNSAPGDMLANFVGTIATPLYGGAAIYQRGAAGQGWNLISHEQGAPVAWTPTYTLGGATPVGMTYGTQLGHYVLRGRQVFLGLRLTLSAKGTSTGTLQLAGLPVNDVAPGSESGLIAHYAGGWVGLGTGGITGYVSGLVVQLVVWTSTGIVPMGDGNLTAGSDLIATVQTLAA